MTAELGLGTMAFAAPTADPSECVAMLHRALDDGITLIDTADVYGRGGVEELIGPVIRRRRAEVHIATKFGLPMSDDPLDRGLAPARVRAATLDSLRRLGVGHLDLQQCHRPDPSVPIEETIGALHDLQREGIVGRIGSSCFRPEILRAGGGADRGGFDSEQAPYSLFVRSREADVYPACRELGIGVIAWSPLNGGWLTGKYAPGVAPPVDSRAARTGTFVRADDERKAAAVDRLMPIAAAAGVPLAHLALAWVMSRPGVTHVLIGPRTMAQYEELIGAREVRLDASVLVAIDDAVAPATTIDPANDAWG